jgi:hypothetical protein
MQWIVEALSFLTIHESIKESLANNKEAIQVLINLAKNQDAKSIWYMDDYFGQIVT